MTEPVQGRTHGLSSTIQLRSWLFPVEWPNEEVVKPFDFDPVVGHCSACGLDLHKVMNYCCMNLGCPVGMGPVIC